MNKAAGDDIVTRSTNWLTVVLAFASASGIVLALLGYGVALAVEASFGLPHTFTFNSTLDLFSLGTWAIVDLLSGSSWSSWAYYQGVLAWSVQVLKPAFVAGVIGFVLFWAWLATSKSLSQRNPQQKLRAARVLFKRNARQKSWVVSGSVFLFTSIFTTLIIPVAALGITVVAFAFCVLLAVLPGIGHTAGKSHIDKWVVQPTSCHSNAPEVARAPGPMANCLSIRRADNSVEKGRVVFATSTSVILYDPSTGHAKRLGIEGSVITTVNALD